MQSKKKEHNQYIRLYRTQGPVSRKPRKLFRPVKPFLVHLYLKKETCIGTHKTFCMKGTSVHIKNI